MASDVPRGVDVVASSVADGSSIDWERTSAGLCDRERRLVSHLRVIEAVSQVYRSLTADEPGADRDDFMAAHEPVGPRWGRLVLLDRIGRGASADVFRAWDVDLEREVALKLLVDDGMTGDAAANARLLREARRLARVRHPHVVNVYGAERHEERIGLWMELVRGRTLAEIVQNDGVLPQATAAAAVADVCGAVSAVHAAGLLHRDVKAQNVVREDGGRIVLMDLGAGAEMGSHSGLAGTPIYLAPEVLDGRPASVSSDIYSLGVLLFFLISGRYPVSGASMDSLLAAHRERRRAGILDAAPSTPAPLARVVERALNPDPAQRFATALEMETALRAFVAPRPAARGRASRRAWMAIAATAALVAVLVGTLVRWKGRSEMSPATSIAVLPLTSSSNAADGSLIADGLTDELITKLGQIPALRVTAHTSVRRFKATDTPVSDIASQLHVGTVLEGAVGVTQGADPRVHVNVRLIRAGSDVELWSDSFDRPLSDLAAVEGEIARAVTRGVHATLTGDEPARLTRGAQHDPGAQQAYLQALSYLAQNRRGREVRPVVDVLQRAITLDPDFAAPHAALARTYVILGFDAEIPQADAYPVARREALRALSLDASLADAHTALGDVSFYYEWDWSGAAAAYQHAVTLEPSNARARTQYAQLLSALGRTREASAQARAAVDADPLSADVALTEGLMSYYERQFDLAAARLHRVLGMDPRFPGAYLTLSRVEEGRGNFTEAGRLLDRALTIVSVTSWRADRIRVRALSGDRSGAKTDLDLLKSELASRNLTLDKPHEAYIDIALDETDHALELLSDAVTARDPSVLWLAVDPRVDRLRSDPRFVTLLARLGRP